MVCEYMDCLYVCYEGRCVCMVNRLTGDILRARARRADKIREVFPEGFPLQISELCGKF